ELYTRTAKRIDRRDLLDLERAAPAGVGGQRAAQAALLDALRGHDDVGEERGCAAEQTQAEAQRLARRVASQAGWRADDVGTRALLAARLAILAHGGDQRGDRADAQQRAGGAARRGLVGAEAIPQRTDDRAADSGAGLVVQLQRRRGAGT